MVKQLAILILMLQPLIAKCDFADYWTVSINDSIIYDSRKDDSLSFKISIIDLSTLKLTEADTLKIKYRTDTPCPDCIYNLLVLDDEKNKVLFKKKAKSDRSEAVSNLQSLFSSTYKYGEFLLLKSDVELLQNKGVLDVFFFKDTWQLMRQIIKLK